MPAEWEPHEATWLAWPHEKSDWPGKFAPIPWLYGEIVRHLARVERVRILVQDRDAEEGVRKILKKCHVELAAVEFFHHPTNRSWTRDYCPLFVKKSRARSPPRTGASTAGPSTTTASDDARTPAFIARKLKVQRIETGLVLEGGSIDVNGAGKLLTTEECLLSDVQARNPGLGRRELEQAFHDYLGIDEVIWLNRGHRRRRHAWPHRRSGSLHRHRPSGVTMIEPDKSDVNHEPLKENLAAPARPQGSACRGSDACPSQCTSTASASRRAMRISISQTSWCWCRPLATRTTRLRYARLRMLFRDRAVVGIPCRDLVLGLGTLHCMTQQQPL